MTIIAILSIAAVFLGLAYFRASLMIWVAVTVGMSASFLATPVVGMLASALVLGENLTATNVTGLVLIVAGLGCVAISDIRGPPAG